MIFFKLKFDTLFQIETVEEYVQLKAKAEERLDEIDARLDDKLQDYGIRKSELQVFKATITVNIFPQNISTTYRGEIFGTRRLSGLINLINKVIYKSK